MAEKKYHDLKDAKYLATKKLLQNYRRLREAVNLGTEHALKLLEDTEYQRLMQAEDSVQNQKVQSVALIAASNRVLWARVNTALDCFKEICGRANSPSVSRGYVLLYQRYIDPQKKSVGQLMATQNIEKTTYFSDMKKAVETVSVLLFGAGNTEDFLFYQRKG